VGCAVLRGQCVRDIGRYSAGLVEEALQQFKKCKRSTAPAKAASIIEGT
jgi:hypothetical protein